MPTAAHCYAATAAARGLDSGRPHVLIPVAQLRLPCGWRRAPPQQSTPSARSTRRTSATPWRCRPSVSARS
eukprot:366346-Chlamydomonas_euryale.AAC.5